jgi:hypothetical protein
MRHLLVVLGTLGSVGTVAPAPSQQCPLSYLVYIVRDAKGAPIDAAGPSVTFRGGADSYPWDANRGWVHYSGFKKVIPPQLLTEAQEKTITPLRLVSMGCVFRNGATLSVSMAGKTMDLVFDVGWPCCRSHSFLIDGLPFQEGRFEITLPVPKVQHGFYPATGWKKKLPAASSGASGSCRREHDDRVHARLEPGWPRCAESDGSAVTPLAARSSQPMV